MKKFLLYFMLLGAMSSCVSKKKYLESQEGLSKLQASLNQAKLDCEKLTAAKDLELGAERNKSKLLGEQLDYLKSNNSNLLDRLSEMSVVSKTGAESIKKFLESLDEQSAQIKDLTSSMRRKDSLNLLLVTNLKRSIGNVSDDDVTVEVKKGVVFISLSDRLLFKSGSAEINSKADDVLAKIAKVVNDHSELDILVEGHTDNVPISNSCLADNWDLSVKRATSVVRSLQNKHGVKPERMTAGGRSEFVPKNENSTADGRKVNRRTEIIVLPKLDQFFNLMSSGSAQK